MRRTLQSDRPAAWKLELDCAWSSIPHPLKVHRGGEDVHIVCRAGGATLIGVFDGVGGWSEVVCSLPPQPLPLCCSEVVCLDVC